MSDGGELPVVEVPLDGEGGATSGPSRPGDPRPDWRKVVGLSALGGIALGIAVSVAVLSSDDDAAPPTTTVDPDELAATITVPPTLTPATVPAVTLPAVPGASAPTLTVQTDVERVAASVETLPARRDTAAEPREGFGLSDSSLAALDTPLPRRSVTQYVVGVDGFEQTVTITNDPATERYLLELDVGGEPQRAIVDLAGGLTHAESAPGEWVAIPNDELAANAGAADMATFLRNLQLGPIRSDTRDAWELVRASSFVEVPDGAADLREWIVVLDAAAVPEWARYAFGPGSEAAPLPSDTKIGFAVYVAEDGSIRRVSGSAEFGATNQRVVHRIEELGAAPVIELPEPSAPTSAP